jgi:periplasmic copper chaperone A
MKIPLLAAIVATLSLTGTYLSVMQPLAAGSDAPAMYMVGSLHIAEPWMRATPKGAKVAGGYLSIMNMGTEPDRLLSVSSVIAGQVEIHQMTMANGVMTMRPVDAPLEIKPSETLELKPGGYHVMFMQLKQGVREGEKVKATLVFEKAGRIDIEFVVGGLAAKGPEGGGQMKGMKM